MVRELFRPDAVKEKKKYDKNTSDPQPLLRDIELEGGAGMYNINIWSMFCHFNFFSLDGLVLMVFIYR